MNSLVEKILDRKFEDAGKVFEEAMVNIMRRKLSEEKKRIAAECSCGGGYDRQKMLAKDVLEDKEEPKPTQGTEQEVNEDDLEKNLPVINQTGGSQERSEKLASMARGQAAQPTAPTKSDYEKGANLEEGRLRLIKARIRAGKIQRRKVISNVSGFSYRGGHLERMSASERRHRKLGAKRAARKTKMKKMQVLRKRKVSLQKRKRLGI